MVVAVAMVGYGYGLDYGSTPRPPFTFRRRGNPLGDSREVSVIGRLFWIRGAPVGAPRGTREVPKGDPGAPRDRERSQNDHHCEPKLRKQ